MFPIICVVLLCSNFVIATSNNQHLIKLNGAILKKLRLSSDRLSTLVSYHEFELFNEYQCTIECVKDKKSCTAYTFNSTTNTCSLYNDSNKMVDNAVIKLREKLKTDICDGVKCKSDAICIGEQEPVCVCLNGATTPDDCDRIEIGVWSNFNDWSVCSETCGEGYQFRKRDCLSATDKTQKISSDHCIGKDMEIQSCDVTSCPVYGSWSVWTPCSTFCGIGVKQRNRSCIPPGSNCGNYTFEQRACGEANCQRVVGIKETEPGKFPLKGYLAIREGDILCVPQSSNQTAKHMADLVCKSVGSTRGAQYAILTSIGSNSTCYPGILCDGTEKSFYDCKFDQSQTSLETSHLFAIITRCIVDGGFSPWSEWSSCTQSCGNGQITRSRTCTQPTPSVPDLDMNSNNSSMTGLNCTGDYTQVKPCNEKKC